MQEIRIERGEVRTVHVRYTWRTGETIELYLDPVALAWALVVLVEAAVKLLR
jgi:hypothetical protein